MHRRPFHFAVLTAATGVFLAFAADPASAAKVIIQSKHPYWDVGVNDPVLSQMCAIGQFNQKSINMYVARFNGEDGAGVLGIAKGTGVNLNDPKHAAKKNEDYFFLGDGTSSCAVFVGGRKPPPKKPGDKAGDKKPDDKKQGTSAAATAPATVGSTPAPTPPHHPSLGETGIQL